jgi:outer membrane protein insertion porin family
VALHGREVSTASPGPGDLYRLGGFRTLRGFREDQFMGTQTAWGSVEYRFLAGGRSFFYGFFDPGYVAGDATAGDLFTYGYGIGMRLETGIGLIGVSFALGEGQPVAETKIHFGLINDF